MIEWLQKQFEEYNRTFASEELNNFIYSIIEDNMLRNDHTIDYYKKLFSDVIKQLKIVGFPKERFLLAGNILKELEKTNQGLLEDLIRTDDDIVICGRNIVGIEVNLPALKIIPYFGYTKTNIGYYMLMPNGLIAFNQVYKLDDKDITLLDPIDSSFLIKEDYEFVHRNLSKVLLNYLRS